MADRNFYTLMIKTSHIVPKDQKTFDLARHKATIKAWAEDEPDLRVRSFKNKELIELDHIPVILSQAQEQFKIEEIKNNKGNRTVNIYHVVEVPKTLNYYKHRTQNNPWNHSNNNNIFI